MKKRNYLVIGSALSISILLYYIFKGSKKNIQRFYPKVVKSWNKRTSAIKDITVHHGASSNTVDWKNVWTDLHISKWGRSLAYHYVIDREGKIYKCNEDDSKTYHNGYNNNESISVCLVGNFEKEYPNSLQMDSLKFVCKMLKDKYPSILYLMGHNEYRGSSTACPGVFMNMDKLRSSVKLPKRQFPISSQVSIKYNPFLADN